MYRLMIRFGLLIFNFAACTPTETTKLNEETMVLDNHRA